MILFGDVRPPGNEIAQVLAGHYWPLLRALQLLAASRNRHVVTSWYRDSTHNRMVGGDPWSQHLVGLAIDVDSDDLAETRRLLQEAGLYAFDERTHVHGQVWPAGLLRRLVLGE